MMVSHAGCFFSFLKKDLEVIDLKKERGEKEEAIVERDSSEEIVVGFHDTLLLVFSAY